MARTTFVKSARKDQGHCYKCGTEIKRGDSYKWFANRIGTYSQKKKFCSNCIIRPSDQTTSDKLAQLYSAQELVEDALGVTFARDDIVSALEEAAAMARDVSDEYEQSADAIVDGFGHDTYQSDEIREKASACSEWADTLDSAATEIAGMEDPQADASEFGIDDEDEIEAHRDELATDIGSIAQDALSELML